MLNLARFDAWFSPSSVALNIEYSVVLSNSPDGTQKRIERSTTHLLPRPMDDSHGSTMQDRVRVVGRGTSTSRMAGAKLKVARVSTRQCSIAVEGKRVCLGRDIQRSTEVAMDFTNDYKS